MARHAYAWRRGPNGPGRLAYPEDCVGHALVAAMLRAIPEDRIVPTWAIVESAVGPERARELGPKAARHRIDRLLQEAETQGLLSRMPCRVPSTAPVDYARGSRPIRRRPMALAWRITPEGLEFLRRYDRLMAREASARPTRSANFDFNEYYRLRVAARDAAPLGDSHGRKAPLPVRPRPRKGERKHTMKKQCEKACQAKCEKKCAKTAKACAAKCPKADKADKADKARKIDLEKISEAKDKVLDAAKKIPAWLERAKKELEALIAKLQKLDAWLAKLLESFGGEINWTNVRKVRGTKGQIRMAQLLMKQRDAMVEYKAALEERIQLAERGVSL